ncbi:candidate polysaccharide deacetylase from carbohydrate esterase family CE4 [Postia placenta Mad-698-R]|uniref:chitin deacetylase n=1 Tax=Postia placenta MAD-698-R-SB12 TaxID=670580 RepID=A0A1X6NGS0_9APHY|nr:carbohydrate esterase family 4 protein [Postia placenta MAD-698-R-SB12]EED81500.1 candidate polysaccharide deacetylase from carbohydrate esterase family CE4 [Postia placenta Mad-698-R]OSX67831.1 carbohydrate esterase family 4 protein [Postia placenta MAD-698-R-SB12]
MRSAFVSALVLPLLASAHGPRQHHGRADASSIVASAASSVVASSAASSVAASASVTGSGSVSGSTATSVAASTTQTLTFTLASTNPTAVPLSLIASGAPIQSTSALTTTWAAGAKPTVFAGAPGLPNAAALNPKDYPTLDKTPPLDSPEVQQWIQEVKNSGIDIPGFAPTNLGGCANNTAAAADASRCWWTCGGCTRQSDITTCPAKNTWGLTYDDGPSPYTPDLMAYLEAHDMRSTFFVVGSRAISRPAMLQDEYMMGNQIAVHTWSHPYMTTKTNEEIIAEFGWTKKIIKDALGVTPLYWRPPYGDIDDRVRAIGMAMNLIPILWTRISATQTFDTGDYDIAGGLTTSTQVLNNWDSIMNNSTKIDTGFIVLEHDLFQQTVDIAVGYILPEALAHQPALNITPVITCQNMPMSNAYVETNDNSTNPLPAPATSGNSSASGSASATGSAAGASKNGASGTAFVNTGLVSAAVAFAASAGALFL